MKKIPIEQRICQAVYQITLSPDKRVTAYKIAQILDMNVSYIYKSLSRFGVPNECSIDTVVL